MKYSSPNTRLGGYSEVITFLVMFMHSLNVSGITGISVLIRSKTKPLLLPTITVIRSSSINQRILAIIDAPVGTQSIVCARVGSLTLVNAVFEST